MIFPLIPTLISHSLCRSSLSLTTSSLYLPMPTHLPVSTYLPIHISLYNRHRPRSRYRSCFVKNHHTIVPNFMLDWWPARELVCQALESRYDVHASGRIIVLENGGCPFKEHLFDLEDEQDISGQILFAIFKDMNGSWRVLAISVRDKQVNDTNLLLLETSFSHWVCKDNS